jgi:iron complex outermembrane receptor protein
MRSPSASHVWLLVILAGAAGTPDAAAGQAVGRVIGVVHRPDGRPAPSSSVSIGALGRVARADSAGQFVFERVPAGMYLVESDHPRWGRAIDRLTVVAGHTAELSVTLLPEVHLDEIVVSAGVSAQQRSDLYQATDVLTGQRLRERVQASLGETLSDRPGVTSTYFGPGSSRPVIRGVGGDRVRVLEGGVGAGDASSTSPDHAVSVEPLTADRIEVIRGPATLLYGSAAIGGVVNVLDRRLPRGLPPRPISGTLEGIAGTVADELTGAAALDGAVGPVAWHASGLRRETGDYRIPGFAELNPPPGDEPEEVLTNSAVETTRGAAGLSLVGARGYLGVSGLLYDSRYGVPGHEEEEPAPGAEEEAVTIDLRQRRLDLEGTWRFGGPLAATKLRVGYADYEHSELEGEAVGTRFLNESGELRAEAQHARLGALTGAFGVQLGRRDFAAIGEEAFVPPTTTDQFAVFVFEELDGGPVRVQAGARYEWQDARDDDAGLSLKKRGVSLSAGVNWTVREGLRLAVNGTRSVKLPNPEELFSNGPHLATGAFERGSIGLGKETALGLDVGAHVDRGRFHGVATGFVTGLDGFIYERATGAEVDGLPERAFVQDDARFLGFEAEADIELVHVADGHLALELLGDYVHAELTATDEPLPRIPPLRVGGGLRYEGGAWTARAGVRRVTAQNRVSALETPTPGYTVVNASVTYRLLTGPVAHELMVRGSNLTDADARNHVSFLKDVVPLPGRDVSVVYRMYF